MEGAVGEFAAFSETVVFLSHFKDLPDPRQRGKVVYPLAEVLLLCLLAVLGGAETIVDIARFGEKKLGLLRKGRDHVDRRAGALLLIGPAQCFAIDGDHIRGGAGQRRNPAHEATLELVGIERGKNIAELIMRGRAVAKRRA